MAKVNNQKLSENWTLRFLSWSGEKAILLASHAGEKSLILTADTFDDESAWQRDLIIKMLRGNAKNATASKEDGLMSSVLQLIRNGAKARRQTSKKNRARSSNGKSPTSNSSKKRRSIPS